MYVGEDVFGKVVVCHLSWNVTCAYKFLWVTYENKNMAISQGPRIL